MKTITLTTWQRALILNILSGTRGDLRTVNKALKVIDILEFTEEEKSRLGLIISSDGSMTWTNPSASDHSIDDNLIVFIKETINNSKNIPVHTDVVDLCAKLDIGLGE
jgi:hypothetical protein